MNQANYSNSNYVLVSSQYVFEKSHVVFISTSKEHPAIDIHLYGLKLILTTGVQLSQFTTREAQIN
jgi:hypothetical protein